MNYPQPEILTNSIKINEPPRYISVPQYKFEPEANTKPDFRQRRFGDFNSDGEYRNILDESGQVVTRFFPTNTDDINQNDDFSPIFPKSYEFRLQRRLDRAEARRERREARHRKLIQNIQNIQLIQSQKDSDLNIE